MPDTENTETTTINSALSVLQLENQVMLLAMANGVVDAPVPYTKELGEKVVAAVEANTAQALEDYNALPEADKTAIQDAWVASIEAQNSMLPADQALPVGGYEEGAALSVLRLAAGLEEVGQSQVLGDAGFTDYGHIYKVISTISLQAETLDATYAKYTPEQLETMATQEVEQLKAHAQQQQQTAASDVPDVPSLSAQEMADNKVVQDTFVSMVKDMADGFLTSGLVEDIDISKMRTDGVWDAQSLGIVNETVEMIQKATTLDADFTGVGYQEGFGEALNERISDPSGLDMDVRMKLSAFDILMPQDQRNIAFSAMERISERDGFAVTEFVSATPDVQPPAASPTSVSSVPQNFGIGLGQSSPSIGLGFNQARPSIGIGFGQTPRSFGLGVNPQIGLGQPFVNNLSLDTPVSDALATGMSDLNMDPVKDGQEAEKNEVEETQNDGPSDKEIALAVMVVETTLGTLTDSLDSFGDGIVGKLGADDLLKELFSGANFDDGIWDANSQDATASVLMGLKVLASQGIDPAQSPYGKNPDGTINPQMARTLKESILTQPQFQMVRDALGIDAVDANQPQLVAQLIGYQDMAPEKGGLDYQTKLAAYKKFGEDHKEQLEGVQKVNAFFDSVLILEQAQQFSNEQAKQTTKMNLMIDAAGLAMDKWAPGLKSTLIDFLQNSELGQMVGSVMSMFGMNVARLWGEKDGSAVLKNAMPVAEKHFAKLYEGVAKDLNTTDHAAIMAQAKITMQEELFDDLRFKGAMKVFFKGQDEEAIQKALETAMDAATNSATLEDAKAMFSQTLYQQGLAFQNNQTPDMQSGLDEMQQDVQQAGKIVPPATTPSDAVSAVAATKPDIDAASLDSNGAPRMRDPKAAAVNADTTLCGDQNIEFIYTPNTTNYDQNPPRFSEGRFAPIQKVLGDNEDILELCLDSKLMQNSKGEYRDTATRGTNAIIEEVLIRAQLHALTENGTEITEDTLNGLDRKMGVDDLPIVLKYMEDKGVSQADRDIFEKNINDLGSDYKSTVPGQPDAGPTLKVSVLDQVTLGNQFKLNVAEWVTKNDLDADNTGDLNADGTKKLDGSNTDGTKKSDDADNTVDANGFDKNGVFKGIPTDMSGIDELRDRYMEHQKGRTDCEHPLFFKDDASRSVFAIIRDKGGDSDSSNDIFRLLEFDDYLDTFDIKNSDADDLQALFDNYNFDPPTEQGVRDYINKVLCLDPSAPAFDPNAQKNANADASASTSHSVYFDRNRYQQPHQVPETFAGPRRGLRELTDSQANFLMDVLPEAAMQRLAPQSDRDILHPIELLFDRAIPRIPGANSSQSGFVMLELAAFKDENGEPLQHPEFDVVVAMRTSEGDLDIRYVQYDEDFIRPLDEQRGQPGDPDSTDIFEVCPPQSGPRRLDDFLDEIARLPGGRILQGVTNGYEPMTAIVPADGRGVKSIGAFEAVYGAYGVEKQRDYLDAYEKRFSTRTSYEAAIRAGKIGRDHPMDCFNDKAGVKPARKEPLIFNGVFKTNHPLGPNGRDRSDQKRIWKKEHKIDRLSRKNDSGENDEKIKKLEDEIEKIEGRPERRLERRIERLKENNESGENDQKIQELQERLDDLQKDGQANDRLSQQMRDTGTDSNMSDAGTRDLTVGAEYEQDLRVGRY